ncbi:MAG: hypothetical protein Q8K00_17785 [Syntrophales bacterium]|nr:hypothetical protein [Syntrophales bacterium]
MKPAVRFCVRGIFPSLVVDLPRIAEIGVQAFAVIVGIDEIVSRVVGGIDFDNLDLPEVRFLEKLQNLQIVTLDEEIFRGIEIDGFSTVRLQGGDARLLDDLEAVGLPRPVHPVTFLARVHHFSQGELEPLKVDLIPFRKDLREALFYFLPLFVNDIR